MPSLTLIGRNLGERHRHLNSLVSEAYKRKNHDTSFEVLAEDSPIERLFKIDLASKYRNEDFIIRMLKENDLLYVSRALKCMWLIDLEHLVAPNYLENNLYPVMITTAVTKMKNWIYIHLKDAGRCQKFYQYYCEKNFEYAVKFLKRCSIDFIVESFPNIMHKISPHYFRILCEKTSKVAEIFFKSLEFDEDLKLKYLNKEKAFFNSIKIIMKADPNLLLDISEKYFNIKKFKPFNPKTTKYIIRNFKYRFQRKPELYTAYLLHINTLAECISVEESVNLVLKLARDKYLFSLGWFSYKKVEPLIKRLQVEERAAFKKKVFVDKDVGDEITNWPYNVPSSPIPIKPYQSIFEDVSYEARSCDFRKMLKKRKYCKWGPVEKTKTMLDQLFDEYRVASFNRTFFELSKRIAAESLSQNRQYMMLVLISKSGGHEDNIHKLMLLLMNHRNEPVQVRAALVRSLVQRAFVWRLSENVWELLMNFGHGLGLDEKTSEINCVEGLHAVVIRQLLLKGKCQHNIFTKYMEHFCTLQKYSLSAKEKENISVPLTKMLFNAACKKTNVDLVVTLINRLLDCLTAYNLPIGSDADLISKISSLAKINVHTTACILTRLYKAKIARRELFRENFEIMQSNSSYLNALRHDTGVLSIERLLQEIKMAKHSYYIFYRKISIYFNENCGIGQSILNAIKNRDCHKAFAMPLTILIGAELCPYLESIRDNKKYAAAIRSYVHLARPVLNIDSYNWKYVGVKAIATKLVVCPQVQVNSYIEKLLMDKSTMNLAIVLASRSTNFVDVLSIISNMKPAKAVRAGLKFIQSNRIESIIVWKIIKPVIEVSDFTSKAKQYQVTYLGDIENICTIPNDIRADYMVTVYHVLEKELESDSTQILNHIEYLLPEVDCSFIENILLQFLDKLTDSEQFSKCKYYAISDIYYRILIKYLLLSEGDAVLKRRMKVLHIYFDNMEKICTPKQKWLVVESLDVVLVTLRYNIAFLNKKYSSCLEVMDEIENRMNKFLPMEKHLELYVRIKLTKLYYKAVKKCDVIAKNLIDNNTKQEATKEVATAFGKYVATEVKTLKETYFDSIEYLFNDCLIKYINVCFIQFCSIFVQSLINGILDQSNGKSVLGVLLFKEYNNKLSENVRRDILYKLKSVGHVESDMFLYAT